MRVGGAVVGEAVAQLRGRASYIVLRYNSPLTNMTNPQASASTLPLVSPTSPIFPQRRRYTGMVEAAIRPGEHPTQNAQLSATAQAITACFKQGSLTIQLPSRIPLIQAPMAGSQGPDLAIAVCEAGG
jgi:hypothetical protein